MITGSWVENKYGCDCGALDCPDCHPELCEEVTCVFCGNTVPIHEMADDSICQDCDFNGVQCCEVCGEYVADLVEHNGSLMCEQCALEQEE